MASEQAPQTTTTTTKEATPPAAAAAATMPAPGQPQPYALYSPAHGEPFQPYVGPLPSPEALVAPINMKWEWTKVGLHGLCVIMGIIGLATSLSLLNVDGGWIVVAGSFPSLFLAIVWSLGELITRAFRKWKAGIHPGAHVGMCLVIWLAAIILGVLFSFVFGVSQLSNQCVYDNTLDLYYNPNVGSCSTADNLPHARDIAIAASTFTCLIGIVYFILFVGACIDTHKRNRAGPRPLIMIAHPQLLSQGWQPMLQTTSAEPTAKAPEQGQGSREIVEHYAPGSSSAV
ncbi:hypothetical protein PT974_02115 [Cladobotryum mycophilum]|uniref:MARVEL domain-containing protein n=1 Tax=Cladobotryum mycophilum TaxID=491253 RepID=A0ABR0SX92_9HYPO